MKILVFTTLYPNNMRPNHGIFIKARINSVSKSNGCQVKVIAPIPYFPSVKIDQKWQFSQINEVENIDGIDVYHPRYFLIPKIGMILHGFLMFLSVVKSVKRMQQEYNFDLIDAHYVYPDGFAAVLLSRLLKIPVVVSARGTDIHLFRRFPVIRLFLKYTLYKADQIVSVSEALKKMILELNITKQKVTVIPNGVDTKKFFPFSKLKARKQLSLPNGRILLSVCRLTPVKGVDLLIRSFKVLVEQHQHSNINLVIIGDGESKQILKKMIAEFQLQDKTIFKDSVAHSELNIWYNAADVFCLASEREGWPNVILEAMATGLPVIASNVGGIPEIIVSSDYGLLTDRNEQDFARKIGDALQTKWSSRNISQYASTFSWEKVANSVKQVYHQSSLS